MTEPAVGASTCASGSHVWNGKSGTLMAKASANARNSQICSGVVSSSFRTSRNAELPAFVYSQMMATSMSRLPTIV